MNPIGDPEEQLQQEFLQGYIAIFQDAFDQALVKAVESHQQKLRSVTRRQQLQDALRLFYGQHMPMEAIAQSLGMRAQDAVVRLLRLKALRVAVGEQAHLQFERTDLKVQSDNSSVRRRSVTQKAVGNLRLRGYGRTHVAMVLQADEQGSRTPSQLRTQSFSISDCVYVWS